MSKNFSRRDFNKLVAAGAAGTAIGIFGGAKTAAPAAEKGERPSYRGIA